MIRSLAISTLAILAALWIAPPVLGGDMSGKKDESVTRKTPAGASASAAASSSASAATVSGAQGCRSSARSSASASANGQQAYDSDEEIQQSSGDGCSATARSSAKAATGGGKENPPEE